VPHGVVCGTLVAEAVDVNLSALEARAPESPALDVYARAGALLTGRPDTDHATARRALVDTLRDWAERLDLPRLSDYGMEESAIPQIVANSRGSSMKTNPVTLTDDELAEIVRRRL